MNQQFLFKFKKDLSRIDIPEKLNNPFGKHIPEIARIAAKEFQDFITLESRGWGAELSIRRGKMFGVLVVQKEDHTFAYLGTISGKIPGNATCDNFIPSVFEESTDDFFINKGMTELTEMGEKIRKTNNQKEILALTESRKLKSFALQNRLFENYQFLNLLGAEQNVLEIFKLSSHGNPPSAAGECAAPKLLHYAFKQQLKPIAIAEFWWGNPPKNKERSHKIFYPACKDKCRPILEYMLDDTSLFKQAKSGKEKN